MYQTQKKLLFKSGVYHVHAPCRVPCHVRAPCPRRYEWLNDYIITGKMYNCRSQNYCKSTSFQDLLRNTMIFMIQCHYTVITQCYC